MYSFEGGKVRTLSHFVRVRQAATLRLEKDLLLTFCSFCHQTVIVRPENLSHIVDVR